MNFETACRVVEQVDRAVGEDFKLKRKGYLHLNDPNHYEVEVPFEYYEKLKDEFKLEITHISEISFETESSSNEKDPRQLLVTCEADNTGNITYVDTEVFMDDDRPRKISIWGSLGNMSANLKPWFENKSLNEAA
jgi:uncharacterized secreted protein with C-terminal beta-propeller domain